MLDNRVIYQVDAFTDTAFKGNPAGVMILTDLPTDEWMQSMAAEMNLSETAFVAPNNNDFEIRFFTPTLEIPLCGHATLASAHVMYELGMKSPNELIRFKSKGGELTISKEDDKVVMSFPKYSLSKIETPNNFKNLLGFEPIEVYKSNDNWIVAVAESQKEIEESNPNFDALNKGGLGHLMVTSKARTKDVDFVVRCFVPQAGINEDPVTGSAHCALTPLWANRLKKTQMVSHQISERGGVLNVALHDENVVIKGKSVTIFEATLKI